MIELPWVASAVFADPLPDTRVNALARDRRTPDLHAKAFGSAHLAGWHGAFYDGSVHNLGYETDRLVLKRLAIRIDGEVIEVSGL